MSPFIKPPRRQTILISGASSGLGAAMARIYAQAGHDRALCARRLDRLEALKAELVRSYGVRVETQAVDVAAPASVAVAFEAFDHALGGIDRVIVNAGVAAGGLLGQGHVEGNLAIARTNFVGSLAQVEAALTLFRCRNSGHLASISSVAGLRPLPKSLAVYSASKAAIASLGRSLEVDYAGTPIRVSTIYPGYIRMPLNAHIVKLPFAVDEQTGAQALIRAINAERSTAFVPAWPWATLAFLMKRMPKHLLGRIAS